MSSTAEKASVHAAPDNGSIKYRVYDHATKGYQRTPAGKYRYIVLASKLLDGVKHRVDHNERVIHINEKPAKKPAKKANSAPNRSPAGSPPSEPRSRSSKPEPEPTTEFEDFTSRCKAVYDRFDRIGIDYLQNAMFLDDIADEVGLPECYFTTFFMNATDKCMDIIYDILERKNQQLFGRRRAQEAYAGVPLKAITAPPARVDPQTIVHELPRAKAAAVDCDDHESKRVPAEPECKISHDQSEDVPTNVTPVDEAIIALKAATRYVSGAFDVLKETKVKLAELATDKAANHRHTIHRKLTVNISFWLGRYEDKESIYAMDLASAVEATNELYQASFEPEPDEYASDEEPESEEYASDEELQEMVNDDLPVDEPVIQAPPDRSAARAFIAETVVQDPTREQLIERINERTGIHDNLSAHVGPEAATEIVTHLYGRGEYLSHLIYDHCQSSPDAGYQQYVHDTAADTIVAMGLAYHGSDTDAMIDEIAELSSRLSACPPDTKAKIEAAISKHAPSVRRLAAAIG